MARGYRARGVRQGGWGRTGLAAVVSIAYFFPVLWIVLTAFKTHNDALATPPKFLFHPTLENFVAVFRRSYIKGFEASPFSSSTRSSSRRRASSSRSPSGPWPPMASRASRSRGTTRISSSS